MAVREIEKVCVCMFLTEREREIKRSNGKEIGRQREKEYLHVNLFSPSFGRWFTVRSKNEMQAALHSSMSFSPQNSCLVFLSGILCAFSRRTIRGCLATLSLGIICSDSKYKPPNFAQFAVIFLNLP